MSALDQAFIKAYMPPEGSPAGAGLSAVAEARAAEAKSEAADSDSGFRPLLQVDGCVWPTVVVRMEAAAGEQVDRVVDRLIVGLTRGRKVVGFQGCRRGDGCTTLLLAAGRRLAARGLKVILVDADLDHPRLARRLGLAPEVGWEMLLTGHVPLAEVAIESLQDRLAILPLGESPAARDDATGAGPDSTQTMAVLREAYDLVLIDLGRPFKGAADGLGLLEAAGARIDTVVLAQNVRSTSSLEVAETWERLRAAGVTDVAVIENFVEES
jgi:Mrp family chromosome partitioning ATPase